MILKSAWLSVILQNSIQHCTPANPKSSNLLPIRFIASFKYSNMRVDGINFKHFVNK